MPLSRKERELLSVSTPPECTKIARFSAVAAAIFTAPPQNRAIFKAPRGAICSAKKIASERRFSLWLKGINLIPTAEFPAIPESAAKIASERRCAILVHSVPLAFVSQYASHLYLNACGKILVVVRCQMMEAFWSHTLGLGSPTLLRQFPLICLKICETPGQLQGSKTPKPETPRKKLKNYPPDPDPKFLEKN